jgi:hypothetical protein
MMMVNEILILLFLIKNHSLDDSDPNPKRKKTDEVNETLVRIPLNRGYDF